MKDLSEQAVRASRQLYDRPLFRGWIAGLGVLGLALLYTLLNAAKPLHIDDGAYVYFARQIEQHPLDPYGGTVFWYDRPDPAQEILAPPVLPYWWAAAVGLFGERPFWWKLWLLPFSLLFVGSLYGLCRRLTRGLEWPLVGMTVFSPVFLPSLNLMLDVPAVALSLSAVLLFMSACDRDSWPRVVAAGLIAGLGMETKYTAFLSPAAMFLFALMGPRRRGVATTTVARRLALWLAALAVAVGFFAGCEALIAWRYGSSHFLRHLRENEEPFWRRLAGSAGPLVTLAGGLGPAVMLLGLVAQGRRWTQVAAAGVAVAAMYAAIAFLRGSVRLDLVPDPDLLGTVTWRVSATMEQILFAVSGAAFWAVVIACGLRLVGIVPRRGWQPAPRGRRRTEWFLLAWLALEVAGYFALTPFVAARRVMGPLVVATLLFGRLASFTCRPARRRALVWAVALLGVVLGFGFFVIDMREAQARRQAAEWAAQVVREHDPTGTIWYAGHWGFQYYAERAGMQPVVPGESRLERGDWLVVPDDSIHHQTVQTPPDEVVEEAGVCVSDPLPLQTVWDFYGTCLGVPLQHHDGTRVRIKVYRVIERLVP